MNFDEIKRDAGETLRRAGIETPFLDAKILLGHAAGLSQSGLILRGPEPVDAGVLAKVKDYIARRKSGEPIDHILGFAAFYGRDFKIIKDVLSPRPETEELVQAALSKLAGVEKFKALDLGTGSGAILVSLLAEREDGQGVGVDTSAAALKIAYENASVHNTASRTEFLQGSWFGPVIGLFDVILSNPPYITHKAMDELESEVKNYDPDIALRGGVDGLDPYRLIIPRALDFLKPSAWLIFEIGFDQGRAVSELMKNSEYKDVEIRQDLSGHDRIVLGRK